MGHQKWLVEIEQKTSTGLRDFKRTPLRKAGCLHIAKNALPIEKCSVALPIYQITIHFRCNIVYSRLFLFTCSAGAGGARLEKINAIRVAEWNWRGYDVPAWVASQIMAKKLRIKWTKSKITKGLYPQSLWTVKKWNPHFFIFCSNLII